MISKSFLSYTIPADKGGKMETKSLEYQLKYGVLEFILDLIPQGFALLLCVKTAAYSINRIQRTSSPVPRLALAVVIASVLVFGVVFLYEIFDSVITGCNRKVCLLHYKDCFLFSFGCRCHFFRRSDIFAFHFDPERRRMKIAVSRCLEKRKGIYSYKRLFTEAGKSYSPASAEEYLSPLIEGGLDQIKFGSPEYYGCSVNQIGRAHV